MRDERGGEHERQTDEENTKLFNKRLYTSH